MGFLLANSRLQILACLPMKIECKDHSSRSFMKFAQQSAHDICFDWSLQGVEQVANHCDVTIIVDVLSFSTCVDVACSRAAQVLPYRFKDHSAVSFAQEQKALLAGARETALYSLSPASLAQLPAGSRLVLPSPNGASLTLACTSKHVLAGCLRNAQRVAHYAQSLGGRIAVIAAGERWADDSLRPCLEDLLGAGAILAKLSGAASPEAAMARSAFEASALNLAATLHACSSGVELLERGYPQDVEWASQLNCSDCVPELISGAFQAAAPIISRA
jgi:2-phosphosulfolactate phosphatase